jgi:hypothetical protein
MWLEADSVSDDNHDAFQEHPMVLDSLTFPREGNT